MCNMDCGEISALKNLRALCLFTMLLAQISWISPYVSDPKQHLGVALLLSTSFKVEHIFKASIMLSVFLRLELRHGKDRGRRAREK